MCTPLAAGALGWGISQNNKQKESKPSVTQNYYSQTPPINNAEEPLKKDSLKTDAINIPTSQSGSATNKAY